MDERDSRMRGSVLAVGGPSFRGSRSGLVVIILAGWTLLA